jgi:hypothetical protein
VDYPPEATIGEAAARVRYKSPVFRLPANAEVLTELRDNVISQLCLREQHAQGRRRQNE